MALTDDQLAAAGVAVRHFHADKSYTMESRIPAGASLTQHAHPFSHTSYLVSGSVLVQKGDEVRQMTGPEQIHIPAGEEHGVTAITDAIWLCIWADDCVDLEHLGDKG